MRFGVSGCLLGKTNTVAFFLILILTKTRDNFSEVFYWGDIGDDKLNHLYATFLTPKKNISRGDIKIVTLKVIMTP